MNQKYYVELPPRLIVARAIQCSLDAGGTSAAIYANTDAEVADLHALLRTHSPSKTDQDASGSPRYSGEVDGRPWRVVISY